MLEVVTLCFIGLAVAAVARLLGSEKDIRSWFYTVLLGVTGAFAGSYLARAIGFGDPQSIAFAIVAFAGAAVLVAAHQLFVRDHHPRHA
jgi:uncharacterized membrane protein YeaQ/YmgE (transglycosylase-associated protein family)